MNILLLLASFFGGGLAVYIFMKGVDDVRLEAAEKALLEHKRWALARINTLEGVRAEQAMVISALKRGDYAKDVEMYLKFLSETG